MARPLHRTLANALGGVLVALTILTLAELGLRLVGMPDPGLYDGDPGSVWWLRADLDRAVPGPEPDSSFQVRTNALGLRGAPPPEQGPWTLALGCSTTFGWGVEAHEAWPALLAARLGEPVVNAGQPGWSTHQALAVAQRWLELGPSRVVMGFIVRDAQPAPRPDHLARPRPWIWRTQLVRGAFALLQRGGAGQPAVGDPRVPPDRYETNLRALVELAGDAEVLLLAFPQREPSAAWIEALGRVGPPVLAPQLEARHFFPSDPIHLTPAGHAALASALEAQLP